MNKNITEEKSFLFAIRIVNLHKELQQKNKEFVLSKQLLRSGTAIGALLREAKQAESKADFIHKHAIALKEANESSYWISLLFATNYLSETEHESLIIDCTELIKLLTSIIKTTKNNLNK
jgi:four helix bundle protein